MAVPHPDRRDVDDDERRRRTTALLALAASSSDPDEVRRARSEVVELNVRIALAVARRYARRGVDLEDLEQTACEGLVRAVARFDVDQHRDLLSYAVPTMRGEVQRYFRDRSWSIRPRRQVQEVQGRLNRFINDFAVAEGREPTEHECCAGLEISSGLYAETVNAFGCFQPVSTNRAVGVTGTGELGDLIPDEDDAPAAVDTRVTIESLVHALGDRDREIVHLRFFEDWSQREIGARFGIKQAQVSRILERVYEVMRMELTAP